MTGQELFSLALDFKNARIPSIDRPLHPPPRFFAIELLKHFHRIYAMSGGGDHFSTNNSNNWRLLLLLYIYYYFASFGVESRNMAPLFPTFVEILNGREVYEVFNATYNYYKLYIYIYYYTICHDYFYFVSIQLEHESENVESSCRIFSLSQVRKILLSHIGHGCKVSCALSSNSIKVRRRFACSRGSRFRTCIKGMISMTGHLFDAISSRNNLFQRIFILYSNKHPSRISLDRNRDASNTVKSLSPRKVSSRIRILVTDFYSRARPCTDAVYLPLPSFPGFLRISGGARVQE